MSMTISPLSAVCGAEITGVDLRQPLAVGDREKVYRAWLDYQVVVFRDQDLSHAEQKRACANFGEVGEYSRPRSRQHPAHASDEIMLVTNIRDEKGRVIGAHPDGEMMWHTDTMYTPIPHKATTLFAVEVPSHGGNTKFSNQYMVYDAVYVCPLMTEEIVGRESTESDALLAQIYEIQARRDFVFEHVWRLGDMIMWDNRCLLHARADFPREERRLLRRVTISDESAVLAA